VLDGLHLFRRPAGGATALPALRLAELPTPLESSPRLAAGIGSLSLAIKREDLSGLGLGGNKPRQLEVILAVARQDGADAIVTTAGAQSNFCRATAAACARLGWRCILLLRGAPPHALEGNLLLDRLFGADLHWIDTTDPYADAVQTRLETLADDLRQAGHRPFLVRLPGSTGALAAAGAVSLADEIIGQWREPASRVVIAAGSGLTAAGLLAGFARAGLPTCVLAISVQQPRAFIEPLILRRAAEALELLGAPVLIDATRLQVDDAFIGSGYGEPSRESLSALGLAGRLAGLVLDPAYTAKALAGLMAHIADGRISTEEPIVFVHTGGAPGMFAHTTPVAASMGH
jgi:1-aminocyclopropane-1-carboxylate deaminase/D-cysteine desulfhydrase-like pyridoxal-dependent ACC family enzyme